MNNLSILIYVADVIPNLSFMLVMMGVLWVGVYHILQVIKMASSEFVFSYETDATRERKERHQAEGFIVGKASIAFLVVASLLATLTPSIETIYLMAGSEAAEYAVTSEYGRELVSDIQAVIKKQLEALK